MERSNWIFFSAVQEMKLHRRVPASVPHLPPLEWGEVLEELLRLLESPCGMRLLRGLEQGLRDRVEIVVRRARDKWRAYGKDGESQ